MGYIEHLEGLMKNTDKNISKQLVYMLEQLKTDDAEPCLSEEEDVIENDSDEDISYYADEADEAKEPNVPTGEDLLLSEFLATTEDALQQSKTILQQLANQVQEEIIYDNVEKKEQRPITPINGMAENRVAFDSRVPSAMRARPKIPRTPIPLDKLEQAHKTNEDLIKNGAVVVPPRNEGSNKKKQTQKLHPEAKFSKEEEIPAHPIITDAARQKVIRSEAKNRGVEDKKHAMYGKKDVSHHGIQKKKDLEQQLPV